MSSSLVASRLLFQSSVGLCLHGFRVCGLSRSVRRCWCCYVHLPCFLRWWLCPERHSFFLGKVVDCLPRTHSVVGDEVYLTSVEVRYRCLLSLVLIPLAGPVSWLVDLVGDSQSVTLLNDRCCCRFSAARCCCCCGAARCCCCPSAAPVVLTTCCGFQLRQS